MNSSDENKKPTSTAHRLAEETGIAVDEAQRLIDVIGGNYSSLVREARIIAKRSSKAPPR